MTAENVLQKTAVGYRSFRGPEEDGSISLKNIIDLDKKRDTMTNFTRSLPFGEAYIITTSDLPEIGRLIFDPQSESFKDLNLKVVFTDSTSKKVSYAGMLNPFVSSVSSDISYCAIVSPSIIGKNSEVGARQLTHLASIFNIWEMNKPGKLTTAGTLIEGEQDPDLAKAVIDGTDEITLKNLWRVFPNNSMSIVRSNVRFSHNTDNGKMGTVKIGEKEEKIGGNEDFYSSFESMLNGNDCVVLINPIMPGERVGKVETVGEKIQRREEVYYRYAKKLVLEHLKTSEFQRLTKNIDQRFVLSDDKSEVHYSPEMKKALSSYTRYVERLIESSEGEIQEIVEIVVKQTIDEHLFFAKVDENNQIEILLTNRQRKMIPSFA